MESIYLGYINKFNSQILRDSAQITLSENDPFVNFLPTGAEKEIRNRLFPYRKETVSKIVEQTAQFKHQWGYDFMKKS